MAVSWDLCNNGQGNGEEERKGEDFCAKHLAAGSTTLRPRASWMKCKAHIGRGKVKAEVKSHKTNLYSEQLPGATMFICLMLPGTADTIGTCLFCLN